MLFNNFCLLSIAVVGSVAGSSGGGSNGTNGEVDKAHPPIGFTGPNLMSRISSLARFLKGTDEKSSPLIGSTGPDHMNEKFAAPSGFTGPKYTEKRAPRGGRGGSSGGGRGSSGGYSSSSGVRGSSSSGSSIKGGSSSSGGSKGSSSTSSSLSGSKGSKGGSSFKGGSSYSGYKGTKAPKSGQPPKFKGSSGSYAHGHSGNDQKSAAIPSKKNPLSFLVRRSERSMPLVISASVIEAINDREEKKSVVLPDHIGDATNNQSTTYQRGFLAGYKDGWAVGEALQKKDTHYCQDGYTLFASHDDPCRDRVWDFVLSTLLCIFTAFGVLCLFVLVCICLDGRVKNPAKKEVLEPVARADYRSLSVTSLPPSTDADMEMAYVAPKEHEEMVDEVSEAEETGKAFTDE
ncbi:MAG: hypothetical protein Q9218_002337 [Villophora microphyllina]